MGQAGEYISYIHISGRYTSERVLKALLYSGSEQSQQIDLTVVCWNAGKVPLEMNQKTEEEKAEQEVDYEEAETEELYECPT